MSRWNDGESFHQWYAEQTLFSWASHLNWIEPDDSSPGDGGSGGETEVYSVFFHDIWCNIYTPRRLREKSFPWSSKKSLQWLKFQGAGVAPPPLQLWESVWAAAKPSHSARNSPSPACSCIYSWPALVLLPSAHFIIHTYSTVATGNATISASVALLHFTGTGPSFARTRTNKPGGTGLNVSCIHWIYTTCPCGEGPIGRSQKEEAKLARWLDKHSCLSHSKQTNLMFSCQLSLLATTNGLNRDRRYIYDGELRCALV